MTRVFGQLRTAFADLLSKNNLEDEHVIISARPMRPDEVIGNPEADDYPILKGKERMMEATFRGAKGQAFTDMYGEWNGNISEVITMTLSNNFRRAIFVSSMNAAMRHLGLVENTVHCRDEEPVHCAEQCLEKMLREAPNSHITMIGHQPRFLELLSGCFRLSVVDKDPDNIGRTILGTTIMGPERSEQLINNTDILLVTGTSLVNGTIDQFLNRKPKTIFYGVTVAGAAKALGLKRYCPLGS